MMKTGSQSAVAQEGEKRPPSAGSEEEKQLSQRDETEGTSIAGGACISQEDGANTTGKSLQDAQATAEVWRLKQGGDKHSIITTMEEVIREAACLQGKPDCPEDLSTTSFSRRSTAAFSSRGNSYRFPSNVTGGALLEANGREEAGEGGLQEVLPSVGNTDKPDTTARALAIQQQQPRKDTTVVSEPDRSPEKTRDSGWSNTRPANKEREAERFTRESDGKGCSLARTPEHCVHTSTTTTVRDVLFCEHDKVYATGSNQLHEAAKPRMAHHRRAPAGAFTALQAPPFHQNSINRERTELPPGVCGSKAGKEDSVESYDFQQETKEGEATVENETEEKTAYLADIWQFKRSASDGPSAILGIWRSDSDFRGRGSTEAETEYTREEGGLNAELLPDMDYQKDCTERSPLGGVDARGRGEKQKWDLTHPRVHAAAHWSTPLRQPRDPYETLERGELNIIRSLSSLSRGISAARERRGKFDGEADGVRRSTAGGCSDRSSALDPESAAPGKKPGALPGKYAVPPTGHERDGRRSSSTMSEKIFQAFPPEKPGKKDVCITSKLFPRTNEIGGRGTEGAQRNAEGTPEGQRRTEPEYIQHISKPARGYVSSLSFPLDQQSSRKVAHGRLPGSQGCQERAAEIVEKLHETLSWKNIERAPTARNGENDEDLWDAMEMASPRFLSRSSGAEADAMNIVIPCAGAADSVRRGAHVTARAEGGICGERDCGKRVVAAEETEGERLVRELVEEFDKRRTNFSILVPKVLELVGVLMGQPAGTQLPCVLPRNFSPAASLLRPAPLPVCATFTEVGQTSTIENLERCFPCFNIEGGLLLCTQGRRLESGGGGKYYFQDPRGHVVGCHKKHLARYDAQGRVASPVLLKTLLFCLVLKQVSRSQRASPESLEEELFRLPAPAASQDSASCASFSLPPLRKTSSVSECSHNLVCQFEQEAGEGERGKKTPEVAANISPSEPSRLLRSLFDPLPPADALLAEVQSSSAQEKPFSTNTRPQAEERSNETGSTSTGTNSSSSLTTLLEELETSTIKGKIAGGEGTSDNSDISSQELKLFQRSESCIGIPQETEHGEGFTGTRACGRLRRAVTSNLSGLENKRPSAQQTGILLGGSPTSKREAEVWGSVSELRVSVRENKPLRDLVKEKNKQDTEVEQRPVSALLCSRKQINGELPRRDSTNDKAHPLVHHLHDEAHLYPDEEGEDGTKPDRTMMSPALSSTASPGSSKSSVMQPSPLWGEREKYSTRPEKSGMLSVVRSSNPQRLVRVYRSLVVEDKTHVVERLLRVWSMTLHVRISQTSHRDDGVPRISSSSSSRQKATAKAFLMRKDAEAAVGARRQQRDLNEETYDTRLSVGRETQLVEAGPMQRENNVPGFGNEEGNENTSGMPRRQGGPERSVETGYDKTAMISPAQWRDRDRRTGTQAAEAFPLRKAITTECGRVLRSARAVEKSVEAALVTEKRGTRGTQISYEDLEDTESSGRRIPRLRRASTSARRDLSLEQHPYKGRNDFGQEDFSGNTNYVRLPSPSKQEPLMTCRKRNDAGQKAGCSSHMTPTAEIMGENEAFLWRPCMSILWVKPLTVEQTMSKWSKSTPVYEPVEELEEEGRDISLHALATRYNRDNRSSLGSPRLPVTLRSTQNSDEVFLKPASTPKTSHIENHLEGKRIGLLSPCSPDSVRSELSTSADCTSSLPPSPLFARASTLVGLSQMDQQSHTLQQAVMLPRLQQSSSLSPLEQSPTSKEMLQAIQKHLLQLIQRGEADKATTTPDGDVLRSVSHKPPKGNTSSTVVGTDTCGPGNTKSHSTGVAPAQSGGKTVEAQPRRSNTWTAPDLRTPLRRTGDEAADSPTPKDVLPPKGSCIRLPLQLSEAAAAEGSDKTRAELYKSSIDSAEGNVLPHRPVRERNDSDSLPSILPAVSGSGVCPFAGLDLANQSPRSPRILEECSTGRGRQAVELCDAASDEENARTTAARFEEPITASLGLSSDGGSRRPAHGSTVAEQLRAGAPAEGERAKESGVRGEVGLAETDLCSGAAQQRDVSRASPLHRSSGSHQRRSSSSVLDHISPSETTRAVSDHASSNGVREDLSLQTPGPSEADLDSLSLISRLLSLTVGDHMDEGRPAPEGQTVLVENGMDHARRLGQSSRKRGLDSEEVRKQEEEGGSEGRKKIAVVSASSSALVGTAEKRPEGAGGGMQQNGDNKTTSLPAQRQTKKTKWSASSPDEVVREESENTGEVVDEEKVAETPRCAGGRPSAAFIAEREDDASANTEKSRLTWNADLGQSSVHRDLMDLFTQVLQHNASATDGTPRSLNA